MRRLFIFEIASDRNQRYVENIISVRRHITKLVSFIIFPIIIGRRKTIADPETKNKSPASFLLKYGLSDELIAGIFYIQVFFFGSVHGSAEFFL